MPGISKTTGQRLPSSFGNMWSIKDTGSRNGTMINGRKLAMNEQPPLKFGTKIQLGESRPELVASCLGRIIVEDAGIRLGHLGDGPEAGARVGQAATLAPVVVLRQTVEVFLQLPDAHAARNTNDAGSHLLEYVLNRAFQRLQVRDI